MRATLAEDTLRSKEVYMILEVTHGSRVCVFTADNGRFVDPLSKEEFQTC